MFLKIKLTSENNSVYDDKIEYFTYERSNISTVTELCWFTTIVQVEAVSIENMITNNNIMEICL